MVGDTLFSLGEALFAGLCVLAVMTGVWRALEDARDPESALLAGRVPTTARERDRGDGEDSRQTRCGRGVETQTALVPDAQSPVR